MKIGKASGPYFAGQRKSSCGHYYPDVIRAGDISVKYNTSIIYIRLSDCKYCGQKFTPITEELFTRVILTDKEYCFSYTMDENDVKIDIDLSLFNISKRREMAFNRLKLSRFKKSNPTITR